VTDRVAVALNRLTTNPNKAHVRSEGGHAWTLKGKCRFCGMTRVDFRMHKRPECQGNKMGSTQKPNPGLGGEGSAGRRGSRQ
jgi:hypothetical protein